MVLPSRFGPTREILARRLEFLPGELVDRKGSSTRLGFMELYQVLAGEFDVDGVKWAAPKAQHSLFTPQMAYGPRTTDQMPALVDALTWDPPTRQAVVFYGTPADGPTPALPCTTHQQFLLRNGVLHTVVGMRSLDLVKGLCHDVFVFGGLSLAVAHCLGVRAAPLILTAGSAHVYDADVPVEVGERQRMFKFTDTMPRTWPEIKRFASEVWRDPALWDGAVPMGTVTWDVSVDG
jgi:thymidylate synthase